MPVARRYTQRYPAAPLDCTLDQRLTRANGSLLRSKQG